MMKGMVVLTIFLFVAMVISPALAQRGQGGRDTGYGEDFSAVPGLNLTAEQKKEMETLRDSYRRDARPLQEMLYEKKASLRSLWLERNPDQAKIGAAQHEIDVLRNRLREMGVHYRRSLVDVLTPEQRETLRAYARHGRSDGSGANSGGGYGPGMGMKGKK
jgi:Spy/CpxP family protein refolding chaperone